MEDKEKIKMLEKQIELMDKIIELQRLTSQMVISYPIVTREIYPSYPTKDPSYPYYPYIECNLDKSYC